MVLGYGLDEVNRHSRLKKIGQHFLERNLLRGRGVCLLHA
jgi:hypothetical protein